MKHSPNWKKVAWTVVALGLAAGAAEGLRPQPLLVDTARVTAGNLSAAVSGEGRTRVRDLYTISAPVDGQLDRIALQQGDAVKAGDVVARIRPAAPRPLDARTRAEANAAAISAKLAVDRAQATEREAQVALEHAQAKLDTARTLATGGALPPNELTHTGHEAALRQSALEAAQAAASQARSELARALAVLGSGAENGEALALRAPVAGKVLRVLHESAGPIAPGTPLLEVGDVQQLEIEADLLSGDAVQIRDGARAVVTGWGGRALEARVRRIAPGAFTKISALGLEEQRVHVLLDFTAPPPPELGHAYRVDVAVVTWDGHDVPRVPSMALFRAAEDWSVFRVSEERAHRVPVAIGPSDGNWTVVTNGLHSGDEVIQQPSDLIVEGTRVKSRTSH